MLGAGVMGLTTARLVQEAGFPVTIYAKALPPETTSNIAGGQFHPFGHFRGSEVTPAWRAQFLAAMDYSWRRFQIMVGDDYGIRWLPTYAETTDGADPQLLPTFPAVNRVLERGQHPFPVEQVVHRDTLYVEPGRFLRQLMRDIQLAGGRIAVRDFATPADIAALPERLVFNCTGLGARTLFSDRASPGPRPARHPAAAAGGPLCLHRQAGYMFPRADGIVLGGTFELDEWETTPEPEAIARILASHQQLYAGSAAPLEALAAAPM